MSFLPSLSPGNVKQRLPTGFKFDNDLTWDRPTEWLDLGINAEYGTDSVPEKVVGLAAVFPNDHAPAHNYVAFHFDTTDDSRFLVDWGDGNPAETGHLSNFRTNIDDYTVSSHGSLSRVASYSGVSDVLLYQSNGGRDGIRRLDDAHLTSGNAYTLTFDYHAASSFAGVWGVEYSFANRISIASNFPTIVTGAWTSASLTIPATRPSASSTQILQIRPQADANSVYGNSATDDQIAFKNIKVVANNAGSGYYYKENVDNHHVYNYDSITSNTSTAKTTPFRGYRQAIFEVTLVGSAKFSEISFDIDGPFTTHNSYVYRRGSSILDLFVSTSNATNIEISDYRPLVLCEQIELRNTTSNRLTTPQKIYNGAKSLQSIPFVPWVYNAGTRIYLYAFAYCQSLKFLPDDFASQDKFWFKSCSNLQQAFDTCFNLQYLPEGLFGDSVQSSCTTFYLMFRDCRKLRYIPYLGMRTGSGSDTRLDYMFYNCVELRSIPKGYSAQRMSVAGGFDRVFYNCRQVKDWSAIFDGTSAWLQTINYNQGFDMTQAFGSWYQLDEFPYIGQFTRCSDANSIFNGNTNVKRFNSAYTHLDFTSAISLKTAFNANYTLQELPDIHVAGALTENDSLHSVFYGCRMLRSVKFLGQRSGPANGEYNRMFYTCYALTTIEGVDFSFATEISDYYQMFHLTRDINTIKFPGTFRAGYPSPRINVTVNGNAGLSGEYQLQSPTNFEWFQVGAGGNGGILQRSGNSSSGYVWNFVDTSDGDPDVNSASETTTEFTPHLATWPANTLTFSEVMTGFKYTVTGNSGDGLRYSPIKRTQMLEIFNQLQTVGYSATLDVRNNTYTADLTAADKAIATDKGWTLSLSY